MGFWSNLVARAIHVGPSQNGEWESLFGQTGAGAAVPLGTARWMEPDDAIEKFGYPSSLFSDRVWIGTGFDRDDCPLGYADDRHVCLVSGTRGGKGVGVIVPNLCFWPGSCIVVDPKGENATVTARRRGGGSEYTHALGQKVCILDPFGEVQLPDSLKARYNPLDAIDPNSDIAIDDAGRIAAALVVIETRNEPYWEEAARNLIKGLILHVMSAPYLEQHRNLVTVRRLLTQGDWITLEELRRAGDTDEMPSAFEVLWSRMRRNPAFNGVVAGTGEQMISMAERQRSGVLEAARTNTEFLDSIPMQRLMEASDFDLGELKTNPQGLSVYLTLPQRFMETHYRWLRLMIVLAVGEMERIKGRPATGHPTLFLLDEFAGLKRMEAIENAAAQAAGFGVKFLFVVQNLPQLHDLYEKSWETFFGNSGLKLFFQIDDDFTRSYLSRQLGELETLRQTRSGSQSRSTSRSTTDGASFTANFGGSSGSNRGRSGGVSLNYAGLFRIFSKSDSRQLGANRSWSRTRSWGQSKGTSFSRGHSVGDSTTSGWGEGVHKRPLLNPDEIGRLLARIDDRSRPGYPGLVLALVPGEHPLLARRVNYFESSRFLGYFDPHPNHPPPPTIEELAAEARQPAPSSEPSIIGARLASLAAHFLDLMPRLVRRTVLASLAVALGGYWLYQNPDAVVASAPPDTTADPQPYPLYRLKLPPRYTADPQSSPHFDFGAPTGKKEPEISAYDEGAADWRTQKGWFDSQTGDRRAGADYWATNRSVPGHGSCNDAARLYSAGRRDFLAGCQDAWQILLKIDTRAASDPQYRSGFADEGKRESSRSDTATPDGAQRYAIVTTPDDLKLRAGPGVSYSIVKTMLSGNRVKIIKDADNGWKELEFKDSDGQIFHGFSNGRYLTPAQ